MLQTDAPWWGAWEQPGTETTEKPERCAGSGRHEQEPVRNKSSKGRRRKAFPDWETEKERQGLYLQADDSALH
ncbi:hypothetical protein XENTR_v10006531 [Xenopus tropicalis]|nr:hypothetical protein XENTR_v10006531 [Xenopus tropicalis]